MNAFKRKLRREKQSLTPDMCTEIDRLGLDRNWFQWVVDEEGLEFGKFFLSQRTKESQLFDRWHPQLVEFAAAKRFQSPWPNIESLGSLEAATLRILEPKIRDAERVPCVGDFTAAIFTAPLHVLPLVIQQWPSSYRHPVFLTPDELTEWRKTYDAGETDQESWWFAFQSWNAELNPSSGSFWLEDVNLQHAQGITPVLITWGLIWGALAGGDSVELWSIDADGHESFLQALGGTTY
jgi:hypothetical protein